METGGIRVWMRRASVLRPATACVHEVEPAVDVHGVRETSICPRPLCSVLQRSGSDCLGLGHFRARTETAGQNMRHGSSTICRLWTISAKFTR